MKVPVQTASLIVLMSQPIAHGERVVPLPDPLLVMQLGLAALLFAASGRVGA